MRRTLCLCLIPLALCGCESSRAWLNPYSLPAVSTSKPIHHRVGTSSAHAPLHVEVDHVVRGPRGATLALSVRNEHPEAHLVMNWREIGVRLGHGQYRKLLARKEIDRLRSDFGPSAYGEDLPPLDAPLIEDPVIELRPGERMKFSVVVGVPLEESSLTLDLRPAVRWQSDAGSEPMLSAYPVYVALPAILPQLTPDWLHLNVTIRGGG